MLSISLPQKTKFVTINEHTARFEILDCYPGYGTTLGNAIRRVLLSSLEGAAVTAVKIKGVTHEFTTVPGVMEDVVHIILNLKKVRFQMHGDEPMKVTLHSKGVGPLTAKDIKCPTGITVVNPEQLIATVTDKKMAVEMEIEVGKGMGYVPVEQQRRENKEIGVIAVDAVYTPIKRVNYVVEDMRVGKRTDYNKITIEIETDGSVTPQDAFHKAVSILVDQFTVLADIEVKQSEVIETKVIETAEVEEVAVGEDTTEGDALKVKVVDLKGVSTRTLKVLEEAKIIRVKDIVKLTDADLAGLKGMGEKGIKEIKKAIGEFGLTLKQQA